MSAARPAAITSFSLQTAALIQRQTPRWPSVALLLFADSGALLCAASASILLRHSLDARLDPAFYAAIWPVLLLFPLAYAGFGLYPGFGRGPVDELRRLSGSTSLVYAALAVSVFLLKDAAAYSRAAFLMAWTMSLVAVPLARAVLRLLIAKRPWWGDAVAVAGNVDAAHAVAVSLLRRAELGLRPVLVLDSTRALAMTNNQGIRHIILAGGAPARLPELYRHLSGVFPRVTVIPDLSGLSSLGVEARDLGGLLGLEIRQRLIMPWPQFAKRAVDLFIIGVVTAVGLPLIAVIAVAIKLNSRGPVFYGQRRYGRGGRVFVAWKFRTMVANASQALEECLRSDPGLRAEWTRDHKLKHDPRLTAVGRLLRKTSLDELPQLWNVLRGQMSVVGPRPIVGEEIPRYGDAFELYKKVPPGLTGLWQVSGRNNLSYAERVDLDLYYIRNWSPWLDLYILARTITAVLLARGAY
ncbi:MAG TPA: undecaprenyl-phosphate galactose phosphotransferase WbaP [Bryobacteraceae bacterium]|nr:undecaprenyl-phosphate galactose phosphotransferase WbaP [Bryobacteraceae bacterium]